MLTVALTGGIASGKTAVSNAFALLGTPIIDADVVSRKVVEPGTKSLKCLENFFGPSILLENGNLNRKKLRDLIFSDERLKQRVESLLHPAISTYCKKQILQYKIKGAPYCIQVIPLLFETKKSLNFRHILVVDIPLEMQLSRLMKRDSIGRTEATKIINSQATRSQRLTIATDTIDNTGNIDALNLKVLSLHKKYLSISGASKE